MQLLVTKEIQLFVLDMAGTTVDGTFAVHDSLVLAFQVNGFDINRSIAATSIAVPKPIGIAHILSQHFSVADTQMTQAIHSCFLTHMNGYYETHPDVKEMEGSTALFEHLRQCGIGVYLDTGFSRVTADVILERLQWKNKIDDSICSDEVLNGRPSPDMVFVAMEKHGIQDPKKVVKVGDTPTDMQQGKAAGCGWIIGVDAGTFPKEALLAAGADIIVKNPGEIIPLIQEVCTI